MTDAKDPGAAGDERAAPTEGKEGLGQRLQHAEHSVEDALKDAVARVENRMILAGEAETSGSPEVNFASALEVALNPPHPVDDDADMDRPARGPIGGVRPADAGEGKPAD